MKIRSCLSLAAAALLGLALVIFSVIAVSRPQIDYQATEGTIVEIEENYDTVNEEMTYQVYVDYAVDGKEYKRAEYGGYSSSMKVGDTVTVLYDPADPAFIQAEGSEKVPYIVGAVGVLDVIICIILLIRKLRIMA